MEESLLSEVHASDAASLESIMQMKCVLREQRHKLFLGKFTRRKDEIRWGAAKRMLFFFIVIIRDATRIHSMFGGGAYRLHKSSTRWCMG